MIGSTLLAGAGLASTVYGASLVASTFSGPLYSLTFNDNKLANAGQSSGCGTTPGWLEYYADSKELYCFDESWSGRGVMTKYSVGSNAKLSQSATASTSGNDVHGQLYGGSNNRSFIASAQYSPSTITTYKLPLSGSAQQIQKETFTMSGKGPNSRQDKPHPHEVALDPTKNFIVVPDLGADVIRVFRIDHSTGKLTSCSTAQHEKGAGPRHIKFWKSEAGVQVAYTVNELGNSVSAFSVSYSNNCLNLARTQTLTSIPPGKRAGSGTKAAEVRVFGNFLYAANRADGAFSSTQDSIAIYTINPTSGALTWLDAGNSYSHYPRTFEINKAGTLVAIGGQTSANVAIVERDVTTGKLGKLVSTIQLGNKGRAGEEDGLSAVVWID